LSAAVFGLVPAGVVTRTSTVPVPAGATAVIDVLLLIVGATDVPPNATLVAPVKAVPVIVTEVPPASGPPAELSKVIVGAETAGGDEDGVGVGAGVGGAVLNGTQPAIAIAPAAPATSGVSRARRRRVEWFWS